MLSKRKEGERENGRPARRTPSIRW